MEANMALEKLYSSFDDAYNKIGTDYPDAKRKTIGNMIEIMDGLSNIIRCQKYTRVKDINVAEHTFRVASLAMFLGDILRTEGHDIDVEYIMRIALLHDFEESINGDIPYTTKNKNEETKEFFEKLERNTINRDLFSSVKHNLMEPYKDLMQPKKSIELKVLKAADMFELATYVSREIKLGNHTDEMHDLYGACIHFLDQMIGPYDYLSFLIEHLKENDPRLGKRREI